MKNLHIVCTKSTSTTLLQAFTQHGLSENHHTLGFFDCLNIGYLFENLNAKGLKKRQAFKSRVHCHEDYTNEMLDWVSYDFKQYTNLIIWHTDKANERLMMVFLCWFFRSHQLADRLYEVHVASTVFKPNSKVRFFASAILNADTLYAQLKHQKKMPVSKVNGYAEQWEGWQISTSALRIWQDGKVVAVAEEYFDAFILKICTPNFRKTADVIGDCLINNFYPLEDFFYHWRVRCLIKTNQLIADELPTSNMHGYRIKTCV